MKLLLYVRNVSNKIELIPLCSQYLFKLTACKKGYTLSYVVNKKYIPEFYGTKINSFSVLVGDNGVGKTSLIRSIAKKSEEISNKSIVSENDCLLYEIDGEWYFTNMLPGVTTLSKSSSVIVNSEIKPQKKLIKHCKNNPKNVVTSYFYSPTLEVNQDVIFSKVVDCSTTGLLQNIKDDSPNENAYRGLVNSDMQRQIDFAINYNQEISTLLDVPNKIMCRISIKPSAYVEKSMSFASFEKRIQKSLIFKNYSKLWQEIKNDYQLPTSSAEDELSANWQIQIETFFIRNLLKTYPVEAVLHNDLRMQDKLEQLDQLHDAYKQLFLFFKKHLAEDKWLEEAEEGEPFVKSVELTLDDNFLTFYFKKLRKFSMYEMAEIFTFSWKGLSSGENALLNLFSRFSMNTEIDEQNVLLFIDEIDLGFHPKWQQQLIDMMLSIFPRLFQPNIQIIMTTHSPLLLSNFCQKDVILLTKDDKGMRVIQENNLLTLGANMHKLLANNFFLKNALMGEFAKKRINEYFNFVIDQKGDPNQFVNYGDHPEYLENILTEIGEPVLRKKAIEEYRNYQSIKQKDKLKIEIRQEQLEDELKNLREELTQLKGDGSNGKD